MIEERFWSKVDWDIHDTGRCWEWLAYVGTSGYGHFNLISGETTALAHRLAYELEIDEIPEGLEIDHLCRNRVCVNPYHLEPVTPHENTVRKVTAQTGTHCTQGHERNKVNIRIDPNTGHLKCRPCGAQRAREYRARKRDNEDE